MPAPGQAGCRCAPTSCSTRPATKDGDVRKLTDGTPMEYDINVVSGWSDWVSSLRDHGAEPGRDRHQSDGQAYDFAAWSRPRAEGRLRSLDRLEQPGRDGAQLLSRRDVVRSGASRSAKSAPRTGSASSSQKADKLLEQFAATSDEAEQKDIVDQLQTLYTDNAPAIPLFPGPQWGEYT